MREWPAGFHEAPSGLLVRSKALELPHADISIVFRGITRGLYFVETKRLLPLDVRVQSLCLQRNDVNRILPPAAVGMPLRELGDEFGYRFGIDGEDSTKSMWLYMVFNSGIIASFTGDVDLTIEPARLALAAAI